MKPSIPKGTRDFSSAEIARRNYIFNTIKHSFELFGFKPIETPSIEKLSTLTGKYGEEGDRLIFKILNNGNYLVNVENETLTKRNIKELTPKISGKALRYDLTVPFARYVVQHQNEITFPFKRYQIQPVWRADRPQKGRFREFYQCDADVVGSNSLTQELDFIQLYDNVFNDLGLEETTIKINNRKILSGIAEVIGAKEKLIDFTVALDKLDKIGRDEVEKEMLSKGIEAEAIKKASPLFSFIGSNKEKLNSLQKMLASSEEGTKGVAELRFVINSVEEIGLQSTNLELDVTLARGLNYYTGAIFEVTAPKKVKIGSIGGGGRYDDLTGVFGLKNMSGIGISFGLDRIYLAMEELGLLKKIELPKPKVLFLNFDEKEIIKKIKTIKKLRKKNIKSELYPDTATTNNQQKKQWRYADKREVDFVVTSIENDKLIVKNQIENLQKKVTFDELINLVKL